MAYSQYGAATTNMSSTVASYYVTSSSLDTAGNQEENFVMFPNAQRNWGYYKNIAHFKRAIDSLATYVTGLGWSAEPWVTSKLMLIRGWGEDSIISILRNHFIQKKIQGDAFTEIVRNEEEVMINLRNLNAERVRIVVDEKGLILGYDYLNSDGEYHRIPPQNMLHSSNCRIGDECHGVSLVDSCKWIIDSYMEAMEDERIIKHRDKALGIVYYETDNDGKITYVNGKIESAVNKGEMLGLPKGTAEIVQFPTKTTAERLEWIKYLENAFYQEAGVPRVIATSENYTQAGSVVGFITFEPIYTSEQEELETDFFNKTGLRIKLNRPPSLTSQEKNNFSKNTGNSEIQQNQLNPTSRQ